MQAIKNPDPLVLRRLYAQASNYEFSDPKLAPGDDYWTTMRTAQGPAGNVRGSFSPADKPLDHIQTAPPSTTHDYPKPSDRFRSRSPGA